MTGRIVFPYCFTSSILEVCPNTNNKPVATVPVRLRQPKQWKYNVCPFLQLLQLQLHFLLIHLTVPQLVLCTSIVEEI